MSASTEREFPAKFAVLADVHGNFRALQCVVDDAKRRGCQQFACLGDIVGAAGDYDDQSKQCIDLIRASGMICVRGNFDSSIVAAENSESLKDSVASRWDSVRDQLAFDDLQWLAALPEIAVVHGFTLVHASLYHPNQWPYIFDKVAAAKSMERQTTPVCFFAHTHVPLLFIRDSIVRGGTFSSVRIEANKSYFVNVGSVGQPRDNDGRAAYVIYDMKTHVIELHRVDFRLPPEPPAATIVVA